MTNGETPDGQSALKTVEPGQPWCMIRPPRSRSTRPAGRRRCPAGCAAQESAGPSRRREAGDTSVHFGLHPSQVEVASCTPRASIAGETRSRAGQSRSLDGQTGCSLRHTGSKGAPLDRSFLGIHLTGAATSYCCGDLPRPQHLAVLARLLRLSRDPGSFYAPWRGPCSRPLWFAVRWPARESLGQGERARSWR